MNNLMHVCEPNSICPQNYGSLLLLFLALLFLLFLDDSSRHTESIVFLEIIVLMHVSSDQQFWIGLL